LRVAFLLKDLRTNGANRVTFELAYGLRREGFESVLVCVGESDARPWLYADDLPLVHIDYAPRVDVAVSTFYVTYPFLERLADARWLQLIQSDYRLLGTKTRAQLDLIDACERDGRSAKVTVSQFLQRRLATRGVASTVIHPGVDGNLFRPDRAWSDGTFRVLIEGNLRSYKRVAKTYAYVPVEYDVWGLGTEHHNSRASRMFVAPAQADLRKIYSACGVLLKPAVDEAFPLPLLEAMSCGLPVICLPRGGHMDFCIDRVNCLIAPDWDAIPSLLHELRSSPEIRHDLACAGRETAATLSWTQTTTAFGDLLRSL